ncbi:MAG: HlyD family efflux transporter periplasmic adaptor subunit [Desulfobacterales bacterium]|nr:HlyD family efflux transporter periplasmic adaptor subunit [Desulfobacterales bacterium]
MDRGGLAAEALEKARVSLVDLQSQLASAQQRLGMLESGPTRTAIAVQEAQVKEAEAKLDWSKAKLAEGTVIAPFTGVVTKVYVGAGDLASLKSPLIELADPSSFLLRFAMPEAHAGAKSLLPGDSCNSCPILVTLDAYPGKSYQAEVVRIFPRSIARRGIVSWKRKFSTRSIWLRGCLPGSRFRWKVFLTPSLFPRKRSLPP